MKRNGDYKARDAGQHKQKPYHQCQTKQISIKHRNRDRSEREYHEEILTVRFWKPSVAVIDFKSVSLPQYCQEVCVPTSYIDDEAKPVSVGMWRTCWRRRDTSGQRTRIVRNYSNPATRSVRLAEVCALLRPNIPKLDVACEQWCKASLLYFVLCKTQCASHIKVNMLSAQLYKYMSRLLIYKNNLWIKCYTSITNTVSIA